MVRYIAMTGTVFIGFKVVGAKHRRGGEGDTRKCEGIPGLIG